jgi:hypothetical protein
MRAQARAKELGDEIALDGEMDDGPHPHAPARSHLPHDVKVRATVLFAQFQRLRDVVRIIHEEFGVRYDKRLLHAYDCAKPSSKAGGPMRDLFERTREEYLRDTASIGITNQNHRLRVLERLIGKAEDAGDFAGAGKLLEQAAKELGGVLTNETKVRHSGAVAQVHLSAADARAELAMRLQAVIDGGSLADTSSAEPRQLTISSD